MKVRADVVWAYKALCNISNPFLSSTDVFFNVKCQWCQSYQSQLLTSEMWQEHISQQWRHLKLPVRNQPRSRYFSCFPPLIFVEGREGKEREPGIEVEKRSESVLLDLPQVVFLSDEVPLDSHKNGLWESLACCLPAAGRSFRQFCSV